ncbi:MAG: rhodanese-like domain-containing protein [Brevinema sp.]
MKKNIHTFIVIFVFVLGFVGCQQMEKSNSASGGIQQIKTTAQPNTVQNRIGALSPEKSLEYLKNNSNVIIVDVATTAWFNRKHFQGAISIPIEELTSDEEDKLYLLIPTGSPVIVHCRLGMIVGGAYNRLIELRPDIPEIAYIDDTPLFDEYNQWKASTPKKTNLLGGISPMDALEYMKNTENLIIVEVNNAQWKLATGFEGAMWIPYTEMADRYNEIPANARVLIYCGGGIVSVDAYEILKEKRPDLKELSYIAGAPSIRAYNEWINNYNKRV